MIAGPEGEVGYLASLEKCARDCGVAGRVIFPGPMYEDDKVAALRDANLFVLPSLYENFANVVAEAVAYNVPVIISPQCGIAPLIDGLAGLVVPSDERAVARAIRSLMDDKHLYSKLKEGCTEVAHQLSWDRLTQLMECSYVEVVGSRHGTR